MSPMFRNLTPPQEFEILKEYLRWRIIQSVQRRKAMDDLRTSRKPVPQLGPDDDAMTQAEFADRSGISRPLMTKILKQDGDTPLGQRWPHACMGFGLTIETALAASRDWCRTADGKAWLRESGVWAAIFPDETSAEPESVRNAMQAIDSTGIRLTVDERDRVRSKLLMLAQNGTEPLLVMKAALGFAENERTMTQLLPAMSKPVPVQTKSDAETKGPKKK